MPDIYRYQWTGKRTGYRYRLDLSEPGASAIPGSPTVTDLQDDAVKGFEAGWEFDKLPIGLASPVRPKITFAVDRTPSALTAALLADPTTLSLNLNADLGGLYLTPLSVDSGMIAALYVSDPVLSPTYKLVGMYVQDIAARVDPDLGDDTVEVQFVDAWQQAGKSLALTTVRTADFLWCLSELGAGVHEYAGAWSWLYDDGGTVAGYVHRVRNGDSMLACTRNDLWDRWSLHTETVLEAITRRAFTLSQRAALVTGMGNVYQQKHTTDPSPSATVATPYVVPFIYDGGLEILSSLHDELARNYPCLYDVIADMCAQWVRPYAIQYTGGVGTETATLRTWSPLSTDLSPGTADWTETARDNKPVRGSERLYTAEMSWEFAKGDDYDKQTAGTAGRNDNSHTLPVVFNWSPAAGDLDGPIGNFASSLIGAVTNRAFYTYEPPHFSFFYPATAGGLLSSTQLIRCASWWSGDGSSSPTLAHTWDWDVADISALADQQATGIMYQGAQYLLATFGVPQWTLECTVTSDVAMPWHEHRLALDPYQSHLYELTHDLTSVRTWLSTAPVTWHVAGATEDLIAETVEVKLYGV